MSSHLLYEATGSFTAWRASEPDVPRLCAIITDESGLAVPMAPETDGMIIAIFDERVSEAVGSIEVDGREGLNRWYLQNVGHAPDMEPGGPRPIMELLNDVAAHLLLRFHESDQDAVRAEQSQMGGQ